MVRFECYEVSLEMVRAVAPLLAAISRQDASLGDQLRRAAASVCLNIAEGSRRTGKARANHYRIASGSASECGAALEFAAAFGYLAPDDAADVHGLIDRVCAMLYRLCNSR